MTEDRFREIYYEYYPLVKKVIYYVLQDMDFAEDVCQEVFLLFSDKADTLAEDFYRQWFLVNAKRKAIDFCRKSYQVHEITAFPRLEENGVRNRDIIWISCRGYDGCSVEDEVTRKMEFQEIAGTFFDDLARKNMEWYEIVIRMHIEGRGAKETARSLGISMGNLRAKRHRIRLWINKYYRDKFEGL